MDTTAAQLQLVSVPARFARPTVCTLCTVYPWSSVCRPTRPRRSFSKDLGAKKIDNLKVALGHPPMDVMTLVAQWMHASIALVDRTWALWCGLHYTATTKGHIVGSHLLKKLRGLVPHQGGGGGNFGAGLSSVSNPSQRT